MKNCELCKCTARVYCESDQASLCWSCDAKVHSANFLVARHLRSLLCHSCQSPTPWSGSGNKLGRTISLCEPCVKTRLTSSKKGESQGAVEEEDSESGIDYDSDEDVNDENEEELLNLEESDDNQVVPLSSSCLGSRDRPYIDININISPEGSHDCCAADLTFKDDLNSSSPHQRIGTVAGSCIVGEEDESTSLRPFKFRKLEANRVIGTQNESTSSRIVEALQRMHHRIDMKAPVSGGEAHESLDLDLNECPSN